MSSYHTTVLLKEAVDALDVKDGGIYVDCTAGGGGHSAEILSRMRGGRLIAIDRDPDAVDFLTERFRDESRVTVVHDEYRNLDDILRRCGLTAADGILADLGISARHVDDPARGFSYHHDAPLDMRMSKTGVSARDLVNTLSEQELAHIFFSYGEEKYARSIAKNLVQARAKQPVETTLQLVDIIKSSMPQKAMKNAHPAKKVFQALRIAVNDELDPLARCVDAMFDHLTVGGSLAVITFHSLEDRIVKNEFASLCRGCTCPPDFPVCVCGKTPCGALKFRSVTPGEEELRANNRARSARLRAVMKIKERDDRKTAGQGHEA